MLRRSFIAIAAVLCAGIASADVVQGRDYQVLPAPQASSTPGKIEVIEFFSYGCPHCAEFHPMVKKWAAALPSDAVFVRIPVSFGRREWGQLVRAYYALAQTGDLEKLDDALFTAIHDERKPLFTEENLAAWIGQKGGNAAKFREAFNSFDVSQKSLRAEQLTRNYRVSGVPQLAINGKYVALGQSYEDMLRIASELLERERGAAQGASVQPRSQAVESAKRVSQ